MGRDYCGPEAAGRINGYCVFRKPARDGNRQSFLIYVLENNHENSMKIRSMKISFLDTRTNRSIKCIDECFNTRDVFSYCTVILNSNKMS